MNPPVFPFERTEEEYFLKGYSRVAGVDEAGRGALAGPLSVGLVIFEPALYSDWPDALQGLNDSKILTPARREKLAPIIRGAAAFSTVVHIPNRDVDRQGINVVTETAIMRAISRATPSCIPDVLLVDGNYRLDRLRAAFPGLACRSIIKGDSRVGCIAAASILAKVSRDQRMVNYSRYFPDYALERHKGYGTGLHCELIRRHGPSVLHRRSYIGGILNPDDRENLFDNMNP